MTNSPGNACPLLQIIILSLHAIEHVVSFLYMIYNYYWVHYLGHTAVVGRISLANPKKSRKGCVAVDLIVYFIFLLYRTTDRRKRSMPHSRSSSSHSFSHGNKTQRLLRLCADSPYMVTLIVFCRYKSSTLPKTPCIATSV